MMMLNYDSSRLRPGILAIAKGHHQVQRTCRVGAKKDVEDWRRKLIASTNVRLRRVRRLRMSICCRALGRFVGNGYTGQGLCSCCDKGLTNGIVLVVCSISFPLSFLTGVWIRGVIDPSPEAQTSRASGSTREREQGWYMLYAYDYGCGDIVMGKWGRLM